MINCDMCDNCPMVDSIDEYHEIHITVDMNNKTNQDIDDLFSKYGGKLTTIEVGKDEYQSMSSIVVKGTKENALSIADHASPGRGGAVDEPPAPWFLAADGYPA